MIKLKNLIYEGPNPSQILEIVNIVYPHIVKDLGGKVLKVEVHNNIYRRLDAVGEEDLMKAAWYLNKLLENNYGTTLEANLESIRDSKKKED